MVRAWFAAVLAQDYPTASALTAGTATDRTRELAEGFQRATGGNSVELTANKLDLTPAPSSSESRQAVKAEFEIQVNARMGPIMVAVQQLRGSAVFTVGRVEGRTRITEIGSVTGLPIAQ